MRAASLQTFSAVGTAGSTAQPVRTPSVQHTKPGEAHEMSAYVLERETLLALVRTAAEGPAGREVSPDTAWHGVRWYAVNDEALAEIDWRQAELVSRRCDWEYAVEVAGMLYDENVASVRYRYSDADEVGMVSDEPPFSALEIRRAKRLPVGAALGLLDCYEYQSCEHPEWAGSEARRFCSALRRALCHAVPGYTWNIDEPACR